MTDTETVTWGTMVLASLGVHTVEGGDLRGMFEVRMTPELLSDSLDHAALLSRENDFDVVPFCLAVLDDARNGRGPFRGINYDAAALVRAVVENYVMGELAQRHGPGARDALIAAMSQGVSVRRYPVGKVAEYVLLTGVPDDVKAYLSSDCDPRRIRGRRSRLDRLVDRLLRR